VARRGGRGLDSVDGSMQRRTEPRLTETGKMATVAAQI
jgi:hypothetical protein